jgi:predicted nucleic acid-binding protein
MSVGTHAAAGAVPKKYLLDVNALIAAITVNHPDHQKADAWVSGKILVTCPLSELGYLRISTHPKALNLTMSSARRMLDSFLQKRRAEFISDDLPALKSHAPKSEHVTDEYLANLAASKGLKLATLDHGIQHIAVELIN